MHGLFTCLPDERQPYRHPLAFPSDASATAQAHVRKASEPIQEGPGREPSQEFIRATSGSPRGGEGKGQDGPRTGPFQEAPRDRHGPA